MEKYTYKTISPKIVDIAFSVANSVIAAIDSGNLFEDEIVQELVIYGLELQQKYRPDGKGSLSGFLNKFMSWKGHDMVDSYKVTKRSALVSWEELQERLGEKVENLCPKSEPNNLQEEIGTILDSLSDDEKRLAALLTCCRPAEAERILGWTHGKMTRTREKLARAFSTVHEKQVFRQRCENRG